MWRLCLALFLLIPTPVFANEVTTVTESFDENGWTSVISYDSGGAENSVTNLYDGTHLCDGYCLEYNRNSGSGYVLRLWWERTDIQTFAVDLSGLNNDWDIKYLYTDDTDSGWIANTFTANKPDESPAWEDKEFSYTETSGKFIKEINLNFYSDYVGLDDIAITYATPIPTTTTTSTTTTTTTTTTVTPQPEPEPEPEPYIPPPPPPPLPEEIIVDIVVEGVDKTYTQADVNDGTIERDQERIDNEAEFGCFMTNAQIERGDCFIIIEEAIEYEDEIIDEEYIELEEEIIIDKTEVLPEVNEEIFEEDVVEDKEDVEVLIFEDDVDVLNPPKEEIFENEIVEFEELPIEFEIIEFDLEDIVTEDVVEIPIQDEIIEEIVDEKIDEEILDEPIQENVDEDIVREIPTEQSLEPIELTEEEVAVEVAEIEEVIVIDLPVATEEELENFTNEELIEYEEVKEAVIQEYVQDLTQEEVVEVLEEVNDVGVQNLEQATEEVQEIVQAVVEEAIADVEELTEEQVEVVAEVLQVETNDVEIIAESVKDDEVIAEAVEEYVERAVENADVENYTLADVVTEVQFETFIENPIQTFIDIDIQDINLSNISNDMTNDQKEKAQEVVVPVILTRIASMAAFMFRRS